MPKIRNQKFVSKGGGECYTKCQMCEFKTPSKVAFRLHVKHVHKIRITDSDISNTCTECFKSFDTEEKLYTHFKSHKKYIRRR